MKKISENWSGEDDFRSGEIPTARSSFSMPRNEFEELKDFLASLQRKGKPIGKSELIRTAIQLARKMKRAEFIDALHGLEKRTPGRKAKRNTDSHKNQRDAEFKENKEVKYAEITDEQWQALEPVFLIGRKKNDKSEMSTNRNLRGVLNGIFFVVKLNARWQDVPAIYTSPSTANRAFKKWSQSEIWTRICKIFYLTLSDEDKRIWRPLLSTAMLDPQSVISTRNRKKNK